MNIDKSPFADFTDRINKDLYGWNLRKQECEELAADYSNTLSYLQTQSHFPKLTVDLGEGVLSSAKRNTNTIILRLK